MLALAVLAVPVVVAHCVTSLNRVPCVFIVTLIEAHM